MPHDRSNILELVLYRDRRLAGGASGTDGAPSAANGHAPDQEEGDARAIVNCLDYLYLETIKLDERMAAHLIGAAAESLRQRLGADMSPGGGAS
jgi:hypothetical protein